MKGKRFLALLLCAMVILMTLSACGGSAGTGGNQQTTPTIQPQGQEPAKDQPKVTLIYSIWDTNQEPAMKAMCEAFTKENPNITVKVEVSPWDQYWTKLDAAAQAGTMSDVLWMSISQAAKYVKGQMVEMLDDRIKTDGYDMSVYPEALVKGAQMFGKQFGIPKDFDTIAFFYNKTLFDQANVPYPKDDWTWDDMVATAKKLTDPEKGIYGVAASYDNQQATYNTIAAGGGYVISPDGKSSGYDRPETMEAMKIWTDLINVHKVSPTQKFLTDNFNLDLFSSGKVAMVSGGSWNVAYFKDIEGFDNKWDVVSFPLYKGKRSVVINGLTNVMAANGKHSDEAWKLLKFLGNKESAEISANMGAAIPAYNGTQGGWVEAGAGYNLQKAFIDEVKNAVPYSTSPSRPVWGLAEEENFIKAWDGQISLEEACKNVAKAMNEAIAEENE